MLSSAYLCLELKPAASVQIAFDAGAASSTSIRKYYNPKDGDSAKATDSMLEDSTSDDRQIVRSTAREDETFPYSLGASTEKFREDYREPGVRNFNLPPLSLSLSLSKLRFLDCTAGLQKYFLSNYTSLEEA